MLNKLINKIHKSWQISYFVRFMQYNNSSLVKTSWLMDVSQIQGPQAKAGFALYFIRPQNVILLM